MAPGKALGGVETDGGIKASLVAAPWRNNPYNNGIALYSGFGFSGSSHNLPAMTKRRSFQLPSLRAFFRNAGIFCLMLLLIILSPVTDWLAAPLETPASVQPADVIVVFSSGMAAGCVPDRYTLERETHGLALLNQGLSRSGKIIFSGGMVSGTTINIAGCMATFARRMGIPAEKLVVEPKARTTHENALYTKALMRRHGWKSVLLVTSPTHMRRSLATMRHLNVAAYPAPAPKPGGSRLFGVDRFSKFYLILHEYGAMLKYKWYGYL